MATTTTVTFPLETEALVVHGVGEGFKREAVLVKEMRPDEVLVEMMYTGICHTVSPMSPTEKENQSSFSMSMEINV